MVMKLFLALSGLFSVESVPTYYVMKKFAANDTKCAKTPTTTNTLQADAFFALAMVSMGAKPGVNCGNASGNMMSITASAGKCNLNMYSDAMCTKQTVSMDYNTAASKCEAKADGNGNKYYELNACAATKAAEGKDLTCFTGAQLSSMQTPMNCTKTCKKLPANCAELTSMLATGCASTCTAAGAQLLRPRMMFNDVKGLDCKCMAGLPPKSTTNGNQHLVPSLLTVAMAAVMSSMQ